MSGAAKVTLSEINLATSVASSPGVYGAIVLPGAPRGSQEEAKLTTSEQDLIQSYTENSSIRIGADLAMYSAATFLQASNKLWVIRAGSQTLAGGLIIPVSTSDQDVRVPSQDLDDPESYPFTADDAGLIYASSPGVWSSNISVIIDRITKQTASYNPFRIRVYFYGALVESFEVSRLQGAVNGLGQSMYVETALQSSAYIRWVSNPIADEKLFPKNTKVTTVSFGDLTQTRDFVASKSATVQQQSFTVQSGNSTGQVLKLKVTGAGQTINIDVPANATTTSALASVIATSPEWNNIPAVDRVEASGAVVTLTMKESAASVATFTVGKPESVRTSGFTVVQAYAPAVQGVGKTWTFLVNSGNSSGADEQFTLGSTTVTVPLAATTAAAVAAAIASASYAADTLIQSVSVVNNTTVKVTYKVAAENAATSLTNPGGNTTTFGAPAVTQPYVAPQAEKPKIVSFNVNAANNSGAVEDFTLNGVVTQVTAASTNLADVAASIANSNYSTVADFASVAADGAKVLVTYKTTAHDANLPVKTAPSSISTTSCSIVRRFVAGVDAVAEQQSFIVLSGNTSGNDEVVELAGVKVTIPYSADTAAEVAALLGAASYDSVATVDTVTAAAAKVTITFTVDAGDASLITKDDGSAPYGIYVGGGDDGTAVTDSEMIKALGKLQGLPITLLLDGGRATAAYAKALIALAEQRMDCVAILSCPYAAEASSDYLNQIANYRQSVLNANTSYAALYAPHVKVTDKYNNRDIFVSPDGFVGAVISKTGANSELWYPPAGFRRGVLNVLDTLIRFTEGEMDFLYDIEVNPIWFAKGKGIVVWGQRTLSPTQSATRSLNVRLLLIVIEPAIKEALEDYVFELNTPEVRNEIKVLIDDYMDGIKARKGVYDYYTVCDTSNNGDNDIENQTINVWLFVKPTLDAEFIRFKTVVTRYGMSFDDAFGRV
ncbi:tail sheath [Pseudomonas phage vB_PpuM-Illi-2]